MTSSVAGLPLLTATVEMVRVGAWHATIEADGTTALSGSVTVAIDGQEFVGTVVPGHAGVSGSRSQARIVGGAGGLSTELPAKAYVAPKVRLIVADILREAGETLSATSESAVLATVLPKWERSKGPASRALVDVLEKAGAAWRVLADGTVWVGIDTYPEQTLDHVLVDEDWSAGVTYIAPTAPALRPGVTFLGHRISYVVHKLRPGSLRTEAYITGGPANAFERIFGGLRREIDFSRAYSARVVIQNADGTLSLNPDDERMRGRGLDRVPVRCGIPATVTVVGGERVVFEFASGDPSQPFVSQWETGSITTLAINGGTLNAGRQGDMVLVPIVTDGLTDLLSKIAPLMTSATGGPVSVNPIAIAAAITAGDVPVTAPGVVSSGNPRTKL